MILVDHKGTVSPVTCSSRQGRSLWALSCRMPIRIIEAGVRSLDSDIWPHRARGIAFPMVSAGGRARTRFALPKFPFSAHGNLGLIATGYLCVVLAKNCRKSIVRRIAPVGDVAAAGVGQGNASPS